MALHPVKVPRMVGGLLAFVAGVVDACTFFALFGLFVAQVTGSFVLAGVQIVSMDYVNLIRTLAIPLFFLAGCGAVFLVAYAGDVRKSLRLTLAAEFALIAGFTAVGFAGAPFVHPNAPLALIASMLGVAAMGVQSALVRLLMRGAASTNVMTTNTTLFAIIIAEWILAARRVARLPYDIGAAEELRHVRARFGELWPVLFGFLAGTGCGAVGFDLVGFWTPLMSLVVLGGLLVWSTRFTPR